MRKKNKLDMTITEQIEDIKSGICNDYCKYPSLYHEKVLREEIENDDLAYEAMCYAECAKCPLGKL